MVVAMNVGASESEQVKKDPDGGLFNGCRSKRKRASQKGARSWSFQWMYEQAV